MPRFLAPLKQPKAEEVTTPQKSESSLGAGSPPLLSKNPDICTVDTTSPPPAHPSKSSGELKAEQTFQKRDAFPEPQGGDDNVVQEALEDLAEEELSETQLRKLFEDEEIERFLRHFNTHVQEVRLTVTNTPMTVLETEAPNLTAVSDGSKGNIPPPPLRAEDSPLAATKVWSDLDEPEDTEDGSWSMIDPSCVRSTKGEVTDESQFPPVSSDPVTLSEKIAKKCVLPNLPPVQPSPDYRFTIGRARLQVERFNLVTHPVYGPFFARMWGYASWKDRRTSLWYCTSFWVLWIFNLLLPALFAFILYALFRRRIFSYPTLKELREHRREAARAEALGEEVEKTFATGPGLGLRDAWSMFRNITKGKKKGQGQKPKPGKLEEACAREEENPAKLQIHAEGEGEVKLGGQGESQAEKDVKRLALQAMTEISDLHERVKNIFLWRRPHTSRNYAAALALIFTITLLLPAKYLAKLSYFVGGFAFWFVPPVVLGLSPRDRARFPRPFADSPTDAQYAMEMIASRVARGDHVVPAKPKSKKQKKATKGVTDDAGSMDKGAEKEVKDKDVDWRKWGERAARGFAWAEGGKRAIKGHMMPSKQGTSPQADPQVATVPPTHRQQNPEMETSTYPAQHTRSPGLLTLTSSTLSFTPVLSSKSSVEICLEHIRGVKKTGKMGGIALKWGESDGNEREEKFRWVGGRDEVFAKLVGWKGRRWIQI